MLGSLLFTVFGLRLTARIEENKINILE